MDELQDRHERALELSQKGLSHSGIAKEMDVTPSTAKKYLREIEEIVGVEPLLQVEGVK